MGNTIQRGSSAPGYGAFAITPNDSADLTRFTDGLYIGGAGNVNVDMISGETVVFTALAVGVIHPLQVKRVRSTSTTATNIVGVYY